MHAMNYPWAFNSALSLIVLWLVVVLIFKLEHFSLENIRRSEIFSALLAVVTAILWLCGVAPQQADPGFYAILASCMAHLCYRAWVFRDDEERVLVPAIHVGTASLVLVLITEVLSHGAGSSASEPLFVAAGVFLAIGTLLLIGGTLLELASEQGKRKHRGL